MRASVTTPSSAFGTFSPEAGEKGQFCEDLFVLD